MVDDTHSNERERIAALAELCINNTMRRSARIISNFYDDKLSSMGLHANQVMLLVAPYLYGPVTINKMAERVGLDRTTLVRNLKLIEERGLVTVKPGKDLRTRVLTLTPKGQETLLALLPLWEAAQQEVLVRLGSHHQDLMDAIGAMSTLADNK